MQQHNIKKLSYKEIALSFQKLVVSGKVREAYELYIAPDFRHHNPFFKGDAESLMVGMEENHKEFPNKIFEPKHVFEDGDFVIIHSHVQLGPDKPSVALVHIFRFENEKIVEMWDVGEPIPPDSPNENGMF